MQRLRGNHQKVSRVTWKVSSLISLPTHTQQESTHPRYFVGRRGYNSSVIFTRTGLKNLGKTLPIFTVLFFLGILGSPILVGIGFTKPSSQPILKIKTTEITRQSSIRPVVHLEGLNELAFFVMKTGTYQGSRDSAVGEIWVKSLDKDQCQKIADVDPFEGLEASPSGKWMVKITFDQYPKILLKVYGNTTPKVREKEIVVPEDHRVRVLGWTFSEDAVIYGVAPPTGTHSETEDSWSWSKAEWVEVNLLILQSQKVDLEKMKSKIDQFVRENSMGFKSPDPIGVMVKRFPREKKIEWWIEGVKVFDSYTPSSMANGELLEPRWIPFDSNRLVAIKFQPFAGFVADPEYPEEGEHSLWEISLKEKSGKRLVGNTGGYYLVKSPSGRFLAYYDSHDSLWVRDMTTGATAVLHYNPPGSEDSYNRCDFVWTSDVDVYFTVPVGKGKQAQVALMKAHIE